MEPSQRNERVIYTARFVDDVGALKAKYPPVHPRHFYHHSTIEFRPQNGLADIEVGEKQTIAITGRVTTDKVDVLLVENEKSTNEHPHITLSIAEGVRPTEGNVEIEIAMQNGTVIPVDDSLEVTEGYFNGGADITK
ncbi:MAG: hypothetical protein U9M92_01695 [Patescibacteria group bacterium]|nr:hypothetical protein [Patescibacteria group bacterium]